MPANIAIPTQSQPVNAGLSLLPCLLLGATCGVLAFLASPPLGLTFLLPLALLPWMAVSVQAQAGDWAVAGLGFGAAYVPSIIIGLLAFGPVTAGAFYAALLLFFTAVFAASGYLVRYLPPAVGTFALPLTWTVSAWLLDEWIYAPVLLGAPVALQHPGWARGLAWWGAPGFDGLLLSATALFAAVLTRRISRLHFAAATGLLAAAAFIPMQAPEGGERLGRVTVVQPRIGWEEFRAAGWSPLTRRSIENRLDTLTRQAAALPAGLIVWPENGNGLPNVQLLRRRLALAEILAAGGHELLLAGREVESGQAHLAAFLVDAGAIKDRARKANLVPLAESGLVAGDAGVFSASQGKLGVAICYDAMFGRHFRRLLNHSAEAFVVTTDDASLGLSSLGDWHAAYSLTRAIESGRSLIFASNGGPSRFYDAGRAQVAELMATGTTGVAPVDISLRTSRTPASRGLRHLTPILSLAALCLSLCRAPHKTRSAQPTFLHLAGTAAALAAIVTLALVAELAGDAARNQTSMAAILQESQRRAVGYGAMDALGPLFRQTEENTCGAAALAFALNLLGDDRFEHDILREHPRRYPEGYSLAELKLVAESRGFEAEGFTGSAGSILHLGPDPAVVHLRKGHFAVVWHPLGDGLVHLFDPSAGAIVRVPLRQLKQVWSGNYLRLRLAPLRTLPSPLAMR